jgi:hypothetical protein
VSKKVASAPAKHRRRNVIAAVTNEVRDGHLRFKSVPAHARISVLKMPEHSARPRVLGRLSWRRSSANYFGYRSTFALGGGILYLLGK